MFSCACLISYLHAIHLLPNLTHLPHHAENYTEAVEGGFHAELSPPYLMYTQGNGKVWTAVPVPGLPGFAHARLHEQHSSLSYTMPAASACTSVFPFRDHDHFVTPFLYVIWFYGQKLPDVSFATLCAAAAWCMVLRGAGVAAHGSPAGEGGGWAAQSPH